LFYLSLKSSSFHQWLHWDTKVIVSVLMVTTQGRAADSLALALSCVGISDGPGQTTDLHDKTDGVDLQNMCFLRKQL
jgi:hypothetical protein